MLAVPKSHEQLEKRVLTVSLFSNIFFAVFAIASGLLSQSQAIIFDGIYSTLGIFLSFLSILAARLIHQPEDNNFHFGKAQIEPLVVAFKSGCTLLLCLAQMVVSFLTILDGGHEVQLLFAAIYSAIASLGCFAFWLYIHWKSKRVHSPLLKAEAAQWLVDGALSFSLFTGFLLTLIFEKSFLSFLAPYADSIMVWLICIAVLRTPLGQFVHSVREMLAMAPKPEIQAQVGEKINEIVQDYAFEDVRIRLATSGREMDLEIEFFAKPNHMIGTIEEIEALKQAIQKKLDFLPYELWLNVEFSSSLKRNEA